MSAPTATTEKQFWQAAMAHPHPLPPPPPYALYQQAPWDAPASNFPPHVQAELDILWHLCSVMNASIALLNSYLSLEPLARAFETASLKPLVGVVASYRPGALQQAAMLHDLAFNVGVILNQLMRTRLHEQIKDVKPYISLVTAAESLRAVTINIPSEAMVEQGIFHEVLYPSRELTLQLRANCNGLAELSLGNAAKGIEGWRDCWEQVEPLLSRE